MAGFNVDKLLHPIPLGVFSLCWIAIILGVAKLTEKSKFLDFYAASILCGVGFTMSLLIGGLAFEFGGADEARADRLGILIGSFLSAVAGYLVLKWSNSTKTTSR